MSIKQGCARCSNPTVILSRPGVYCQVHWRATFQPLPSQKCTNTVGHTAPATEEKRKIKPRVARLPPTLGSLNK